VSAGLKKSGVKTCEALFTKIHAAVRKNPDRAAAKKVTNPKRDHKKFV